ncbi:MAG: tyrosine--tRNA ligase, partial [Alphaproteobacteria bacterium HGW-Alphaproteobacteria-16]
YWQFWRNTDDRDVGKFLRLFTDLPLDEIARLESLEGAEINEAKKILATEATAMCRGRDAALAAEETARKTFEEGASGDTLPTLAVAAEGIGIVQANVAIGFAASNKEVKRKIEEGAIRLNGEKVTSLDAMVKPGDKISFGQKKHGLIVAA